MKSKAKKSRGSSIEDLRGLIRALRGEGGCPWDRKQTVHSVKGYLLEEAYEVLDALEKGDEAEVMAELGDLLFQIVFIINFFEEEKRFALEDVILAVREKMIRRHPHVFGDATVEDAREVVQNWAKIKELERKDKGGTSLLDSIPVHLPALLKAHRVGERTSKVGFDWEDAKSAASKVEEEWGEFRSVIEAAEPRRSMIAEELGDLLFSMVNVARLMGINAEFALHSTVNKFMRRFSEVAQEVERSGKALGEATLDEMDTTWDQAKERHAAARKDRLPQLDRIQKELTYSFQSIELLDTALCHSSFAHENPNLAHDHNERLEFLGDAILDLVVSRLLFKRFPDAREGDLTRRRASLVNETRLSEVARAMDLGSALLLGTGEEAGGGRNKNSILADGLEALFAAVYLDGGMGEAGRVVESLFSPLIDDAALADGGEDYKTRLQELTQARYKITPEYRLTESLGPDHDKTFRISLWLMGKQLAAGSGKSKKEAAQNAAREALKTLEESGEEL